MSIPPTVTIILAIFGVFALFLGAWFAAVDTAISRMTVAYADDLVEQQRKGSHTLRQAVRERKEFGTSLASARVLSTTVGVVSLTVVLADEFWDLDWAWWLTLAVTLAIVAAVQLLALGFSTRLNAGSRYVKVALVGSNDEWHDLNLPSDLVQSKPIHHGHLQQSFSLQDQDSMLENHQLY